MNEPYKLSFADSGSYLIVSTAIGNFTIHFRYLGNVIRNSAPYVAQACAKDNQIHPVLITQESICIYTKQTCINESLLNDKLYLHTVASIADISISTKDFKDTLATYLTS